MIITELEKLLLEQNSTPILLLDKSLNSIFKNKSFIHFFEPDTNTGFDLSAFTHHLSNIISSNILQIENESNKFETESAFTDPNNNQVKFKLQVKFINKLADKAAFVCSFARTKNDDLLSFLANDNQLLYRNLIENSLEIIQSFDKEGNLLFCNPEWLRLLEYTFEETKAINLFDIIAPEYKDHCSILFQQVLSGKKVKDIEVEFVSKSGKRIFLEGNAVPLLKDGELVATHAFFRDITEKKLSIEKINQQEKLIQTVFGTVPICLYMKDSSGRYILANDAMKKTFDADVIDEFDSQLFPESCHSILAETDQEAIDAPDQIINFEINAQTKNKVKQFFSGKKAIFNSVTNDYQLFGFLVDISDLKNANNLILEKEAHLYSIINNTSGGILLFKQNSQKDGFVLDYFNEFAANLFNIEAGKFLLSKLFSFLNPDFLNQLVPDVIQQQEDFDIETEFELQPSNSSTRYFKAQFSKIKSKDDFKLLAYVIEITTEKKLINELERKLHENDILLGEVHHRVKNNLAVIDSIIELRKVDNENQLLIENLTKIQMRIKSIAIVHQKLYQTGLYSELDIRDYFNELIKHYKFNLNQTANRNLEFNIDSITRPYLDLQKAISFALLFNELISNSIENAFENNFLHIDISIEKVENSIVINYKDSGKGLPAGISDFNHGGFGFRLIVNFIKQLKATIELVQCNNFCVKIIIPCAT